MKLYFKGFTPRVPSANLNRGILLRKPLNKLKDFTVLIKESVPLIKN